MNEADDVVRGVEAVLVAAGIVDAAAEAARIAQVAEVGTADDALRLARMRADGTPLAYVLGRENFMGFEFFAEPGVIVPREVSALVVRTLIRLLAANPPSGEPRIVDVCSGSGNLACALALSLPSARVWSADLMPECSALARRNVEKHGLTARVEIVTGDLFAPLAGLEATFDAITASPPFISTGRLAKDRAYLLEHEPRAAFDGGAYGLSIHQRLVKEALPLLRPGGFLVCEVGEGQDRQVRSLFERAGGFEGVEVANDERGLPLAVHARKRR